ncbi:hypothetical protein [Cupriavidus sp. IDO]|uniref:hypothetical protein n=1 Tax=Cupriavidus sp. IDO TaxID=1539142 RepID=UPI0012699D1A|nr:hypothetical protein [Cupriavidus sp. IDO]
MASGSAKIEGSDAPPDQSAAAAQGRQGAGRMHSAATDDNESTIIHIFSDLVTSHHSQPDPARIFRLLHGASAAVSGTRKQQSYRFIFGSYEQGIGAWIEQCVPYAPSTLSPPNLYIVEVAETTRFGGSGKRAAPAGPAHRRE